MSVQVEEQVRRVGRVASPASALVALIHGCLAHRGFRCVGLGESGPEVGVEAMGLPEGWQSNGDTFSLRYKHDQSSLTFVVKAVQVSQKMLVHGMALEDGNVHSVEWNVFEYIKPSATFPLEDATTATISAEQLQEALNKVDTQLVDKLIPGIRKVGYEAPRTEPPSRPQAGPSYEDPLRDPLRDPRFAPGRGGGFYHGPPGPSPYGIGDVDLDPFAAAPGVVPFPRGMHPGGGMFVGPDHPMFYPPQGPMDPRGRLPPGAVPPGARFDPIMPFGGIGRPPRPRPGPGPGPSGYFSGEPDNDALPPPGYDPFM